MGSHSTSVTSSAPGVPRVQRPEPVEHVYPPQATVPLGAPMQSMDRAFIEQIVRDVVAGMVGVIGGVNTERVKTLVYWIKSMREMRCTPYLGEEDAEISRRWLRKVEESFFQILVPEDVQVNCVAQLLYDEAQTWWDTVKERRT